MTALVPVVLAVHIGLAVALLVPSVLLPFALRSRRPVEESRHPLVRLLLGIQGTGTGVIGIGLAASGFLLVVLMGPQLLGQPWLLVALAIYAANLGLAWFVQRPGLRRLVGIRVAGDDRIWAARARRQRYVAYAMAGMVGTIAFLMSAKPAL